MALRPPTARSRYALATRPEQNRQADARRGSARARGYTTEWTRAAKAHLAEHPLCRYCETGAFGPPRIAGATLVDHLYPHGGDQQLFWDRRWWVSSCTPCHSGPKQRVERRGRLALEELALALKGQPRPVR